MPTSSALLALKQLSYMQAIHETGARLTHDVKNLLQSLNALCSAGPNRAPSRRRNTSPCCGASCRRSASGSPKRWRNSMPRRAPRQRAGCRPPIGGGPGQRMAALEWMRFKAEPMLAGRTAGRGFLGRRRQPDPQCRRKAPAEPDLRVDVELKRNDAGFELVVCDNGSAMADSVASSLFLGPVSSESGYGIGLYNAARYAAGGGLPSGAG
jgi:hypothetical protein